MASNKRMRRNPILDTITNAEIREKHKELGNYPAVAKFYHLSVYSVQRAVTGARQCPSLRPGNLKY